MSNRMWENTVGHAKTCVLDGKLYVYYTDQTQSTGAVFNHIYELRGLIADGQFLSLESLNYNQKVEIFKIYSVKMNGYATFSFLFDISFFYSKFCLFRESMHADFIGFSYEESI